MASHSSNEHIPSRLAYTALLSSQDVSQIDDPLRNWVAVASGVTAGVAACDLFGVNAYSKADASVANPSGGSSQVVSPVTALK
mmetsp:Transcript_5576/g.13589  ORF Transcript_5576/g.13589 Transcript_5576/m.13589 type:complete len:83 (+) Transcript_5576:112-360(+)